MSVAKTADMSSRWESAVLLTRGLDSLLILRVSSLTLRKNKRKKFHIIVPDLQEGNCFRVYTFFLSLCVFKFLFDLVPKCLNRLKNNLYVKVNKRINYIK